MRKIVLLLLLTVSLFAKNITPNEVYSQVMIITDEVHFLLNYYDIKHDNDNIDKRSKLSVKLKPRNTWQITYEIMVKINILREEYGLPIIEPVNMSPVLHLNPDLVYEQTQRILTELKIFEIRVGAKAPKFKEKKYKGKTSVDVYNAFTDISRSFDELNKGVFTPSYVYGEQMRVFDDITLILQTLHITDKTIPKKKIIGAAPVDVFNECMNVLEKIKHLQISAGIDFSDFKKGHETASEVYTLTQMIIAELQTIKAYLGIERITPAATKYHNKTPSEVAQLVSWNLRKLNLIDSLNKGQ